MSRLGVFYLLVIAVLVAVIVGMIMGHMKQADNATRRGSFSEGFMAFVATTALILGILGWVALPISGRDSSNEPKAPESRSKQFIPGDDRACARDVSHLAERNPLLSLEKPGLNRGLVN